MDTKLIKLTEKLMRVDSSAHNAKGLQEVLKIAEREISGFPILRYVRKGKPSLLVHNGKTKDLKFKVILNAHLDVVPANADQFIPKIKNGKLFGRGAMDMKGGAAAEILAFKEFAKKVNYPLALQLVTDEEIGGFDGTKHQIDKGVRGQYVLAGEPTDLAINNRSKGVIWATITFKGDSAHGAYLWEGENAIWKMNAFLKKLEKIYPKPNHEVWDTTVNLAYLETTNKTVNKSADKVTLGIDIRYLRESGEKIKQRIRKMLPAGSKINIFFTEPVQDTSENSPLVKKLEEAIKKSTNLKPKLITKHGGSDVRFYDLFGSDTVTFGPKGRGIHKDLEWVDVKSLQDFYEVLISFLLAIE